MDVMEVEKYMENDRHSLSPTEIEIMFIVLIACNFGGWFSHIGPHPLSFTKPIIRYAR